THQRHSSSRLYPYTTLFRSFSSNNYLGLANHPRVVEAAKQSMDTHGVGPAAVRSIAGTMDLHLELEERLARFKGAEAAVTFQSGDRKSTRLNSSHVKISYAV